jgi:hypothetical protein
VSIGGSAGAAGTVLEGAGHAAAAVAGRLEGGGSQGAGGSSFTAAPVQTIAPASIFADAGRAALFPSSQREEIALGVLEWLTRLPVPGSTYALFKGLFVSSDGTLPQLSHGDTSASAPPSASPCAPPLASAPSAAAGVAAARATPAPAFASTPRRS